MAFFASAGSPARFTALAWLLEDGTRKFYEELSRTLDNADAVELFQELIAAEEHHKETLSRLYANEFLGKETDRKLEELLADEQLEEELMEGGVPLAQALNWARGKQLRDILEQSISIEANAYDRYLVMRRSAAVESSRRVFEVLSDEEKRHLLKLTDLFDSMP